MLNPKHNVPQTNCLPVSLIQQWYKFSFLSRAEGRTAPLNTKRNHFKHLLNGEGASNSFKGRTESVEPGQSEKGC